MDDNTFDDVMQHIKGMIERRMENTGETYDQARKHVGTYILSYLEEK